jgi:hypothetical protein
VPALNIKLLKDPLGTPFPNVIEFTVHRLNVPPHAAAPPPGSSSGGGGGGGGGALNQT